MSSNEFGKLKHSLSQNISNSNSNSNKKIDSISASRDDLEKLPNFHQLNLNFDQKSNDHVKQNHNNLSSFDVLGIINNNPIDSINNSASINNSINSINSINKNVQIDDDDDFDDFDGDEFIESLGLTSPSTNKPQSDLYKKFCQDPCTQSELVDAGKIWLESVCGQSIPYLILDGRWHYINRKRKAGYKGILSLTANGSPLLKLQYHEFSHGGFREYFKSSEALRDIYRTWKIYNAPASHSNNKNKTKSKLTQQPLTRQTYLQSIKALQASKLAQQAIKDAQEAAAKEASLAKEHKLWETLSTTGNSKYLVNKALGCVQGQSINAIRYGDGFIMVQIIDIFGQVKGYQTIFDDSEKKDNEKKFSYGLKKTGNFILLNFTPKINKPNENDNSNISNTQQTSQALFIGSKANKSKSKSNRKAINIYVVEGLATGLSVKVAKEGSASDYLVVCALDVGNILPVVAQLRKCFPSTKKHKIFIVGDNDQWKQDQINPSSGCPIGNVGLIAANKTALKYRCFVITPNFDAVDITSNPTDINDLHQIAGIDEVKRQLKLVSQPNPKYACWRQREVYLERIRALFSKHTVVELNERYLNDYPDQDDGQVRLLAELFGKHKVTTVLSPTNTGKTEVFSRFRELNPHKSVLYISPRIALSQTITKRLNLEFYQDFKGSFAGRTYLQTTNGLGLGIVVNSLAILVDELNNLKLFDVIIIDEVEQLLRHLMSKIENKALVLECLYTLIRNAKHVIVADAHLGKVTMDWLTELRPNEKFLSIINTYEIGQGNEVIFYPNAEAVEMAAIAALIRGENVYLTFNNKKAAKAFRELVKKFLPSFPRQLVSADNNDDLEVRLIFNDPNNEVKKYRALIVTPSLSTGVSIDIEHFDFVGGIFTAAVGTPQDAQQALARVRKARVWHVHLDDRKQSFPTDDETISSKWLKTHSYDQALLRKVALGRAITNADNINYGFIDPVYERLCLNATKNQNYLANDFLTNFTRELFIAGYSFSYAENNELKEFASKCLAKVTGQLEEKEYIESRTFADKIAPIEAQKLKKKIRRTENETCELESFVIREFYRAKQDIDDKDLSFLIKQDQRGKLRRQISSLELALSNDQQLLIKYEEQDLSGVELRPDMNLYAIKRELYKIVLTSIGVDLKGLVYDGRKYSKESLSSSELITYLTKNCEVLVGIINLPKNEQLLSDPIRYLSLLLKRLGLKQKRVGNSINGEYMLVVSRLEFLRAIVMNRGVVELG